jgi:LuxR family transcriptional regulator
MTRPLTHNDRYLLTSLVPMLHVAGKGQQLQTRALTPKELEILKWAREGKTAWEIGLIKEVSEATVKHHFKSIYAKLGVTNRAQAVGEALCRGIIQ